MRLACIVKEVLLNGHITVINYSQIPFKSQAWDSGLKDFSPHERRTLSTDSNSQLVALY